MASPLTLDLKGLKQKPLVYFISTYLNIYISILQGVINLFCYMNPFYM